MMGQGGKERHDGAGSRKKERGQDKLVRDYIHCMFFFSPGRK